jgi:hypothetical protein
MDFIISSFFISNILVEYSIYVRVMPWSSLINLRKRKQPCQPWMVKSYMIKSSTVTLLSSVRFGPLAEHGLVHHQSVKIEMNLRLSEPISPGLLCAVSSLLQFRLVHTSILSKSTCIMLIIIIHLSVCAATKPVLEILFVISRVFIDR